MYYKVHEALAEKIPKPNLVVYLSAKTDVLMQRIAHRDRPYERAMERAYIDELNQAYESFFINSDLPYNVLKIDTDNLNIISRPDDLALVETRIRQALKLVPFQESLPLAT